mmetsp:Transcript_21221/g.25254  ORF Transcript_21221/g.25254 Transcript_21221/m.25254 type:complete len:159 (+) Transcript_21221:143-619(+)
MNVFLLFAIPSTKIHQRQSYDQTKTSLPILISIPLVATATMGSFCHPNHYDGDGDDAGTSIPVNNKHLPPFLPSSNIDGDVPFIRKKSTEDTVTTGDTIDIDVDIDINDGTQVLRDETFFDLIVGTGFVNEAAGVEEVGGDPSFLPDYDENDDEKWDE